jgi:hypothetical protein
MIHGVMFSKSSSTLTRVYQYLDVPAGVFQGLLDADSHGTYFNEEIKNRYPFRMIRKPPNF